MEDPNRTAAVSSSTLRDEASVGPATRPRGAELFRTLNSADWVGSVGSQGDSLGNVPHLPNETTCQKVTQICRQVERRHALLNLYQEFERMTQSYTTGTSQYDNAVLFVTDRLSVQCTQDTVQSRRPPEEGYLDFLKDAWGRFGGDFNLYGITVREFVLKNIREGGRWRDLNDNIGTAVLLLSDYDGDDQADIVNCPTEEMLDMTLLENRFPYNFKAIDIVTIIQHGANEVFAKMRVLLLSSELQLKETCQGLGGLVDLICRWMEINHHGIQSEVGYHASPLALERASACRILARTVQDQVNEVLGELLMDHNKRSNEEDCTTSFWDGEVGSDEDGFRSNYCELGLYFENISFPL